MSGYEISTQTDNDTVIVETVDGEGWLELDDTSNGNGVRVQVTPTEMRRIARMLLENADELDGIELEN